MSPCNQATSIERHPSKWALVVKDKMSSHPYPVSPHHKKTSVLLAQFMGSDPVGDIISDLLRRRMDDDEAMEKLTVRTQSATRTCTTIVSTEHSTELVEPSGLVSDEDWNEMIRRFELLSCGNDANNERNVCCSALCVMGSMPPGCPDGGYAELYKRLVGGKRRHRSVVLIDSVVGLSPLFCAISDEKAVENGQRVMLKINASELRRLVATTQSADRDNLGSVVERFLSSFDFANDALDCVAITDGSQPAHFVKVSSSSSSRKSFQMWKLDVADLSSEIQNRESDCFLYPIGAGDAVAAGTLAAWQHSYCGGQNGKTLLSQEESVVEAIFRRAEEFRTIVGDDGDDGDTHAAFLAFAFGLACGSASCLNEENSVLDVGVAVNLFSKMLSPSPVN